MTTQKSIRTGAILALLLLLGMVIFSIWVVRSFGGAGDWVLHTNEVQQLLETFLSSMRSVESNARGYMLTGNEAFLESFGAAQGDVDQALSELRRLTRDNPRQQTRLTVIEPLISRKMAVMAQGINLRRQEGLEPASSFISTSEGRVLMDRIRSEITAMQAEERALLTVRLSDARRSAGMAVAVLATGLLVDLALLLAVYFLVRRDLREREQAAEVLKKSADEIKDLYNRAPCGYHSLDTTGTYVAVNDTELSWLGYARQEVQGKRRFADLIAEGGRRRFEEAFARLKEEGRIKDLEFELVRKDGSTFPVLLNATALVDGQGRFLASRSTIIDLTARAQAEQVVQQARAYFESIVDTVREPLVILTSGLHVNSASRSFYETFQTTPEATVGLPLAELGKGMWAIPELIHALEEIVPQQTALNDFEVDREFPRLGRRVMMLNARKLHRPGNNTAMILLAIEDATARKQAMEELEAFSYSVSHDLRAPLRHIDGYAGLLEASLAGADEEAKRCVRIISSAAFRMGTLIDDLLAFSQIGRAELRRGPVELDGLVREVRQTFEAESAGRVIEWIIAPLPIVDGDRTLIEQVFLNLLGNAVKYTRRRSHARIEIQVLEKGPIEVVLCIRDNGAGFDMAYADKLFDVFQRLHSSAEFEGTGVGLALVRRIIQRHGGRIWAEGKVDAGASFYFSLPAYSR